MKIRTDIIVPILLASIILTFLPKEIWKAVKVTQKVEPISKSEQEKLALDFDIDLIEYVSDRIYPTNINDYDTNPYKSNNQLYRLTTDYYFGKVVNIGDYQRIKRLKCVQYQFGLSKIKEHYDYLRKQKEAEKQNEILLEKAEKQVEELNSLNCIK